MIEIDLHIQHHFADGMYAKRMRLPAGHFAVSHKHSYGHLSILAQGVAEVEADGVKTTYGPGSCIHIAAGVEHKITAIEDVVWFCIHATDETDADKVDQVLIARD